MGLTAIAAASPVSIDAVERVAKKGRKKAVPRVNQVAKTGKLKLSFFPYELKLRHAFNLARYSRTTTPDVQVTLEYEGIKGYGEASMPPYLGESVESVTTFLNKLDLEQFKDPFCIEDILTYVDSVDENNRAAKASIDIALHDLLGKIMGQPWYKIWGYNPEKTPVTSFTIGIDTPEVVRHKVEEARPYKLIKAKMGLDQDQATINIKLMKSTGLYEAHKMVTLARALDMKVMIGCMTETSCAVTAAANLSPVVDYADLDGNLLIANDRFTGMTVENGKITLHDRPGLGIKLLK